MTKQENQPVSVLMVAIGGYGHWYLKALQNEVPASKAYLCGVVDPYADQSVLFPDLIKSGVPIVPTIEDFYQAGHDADLAVISSPIHYHIPQSCCALQNGSQVLCDKPLGATVQEVDQLIRERDQAGKWVMVGYQWSFSKAIQSLKKDILAGQFGKPIRLKTMCLWPRDDGYYQRNDWAGKIKDSQGRWILDSPVNNALAHYLHNIFFVLGEELHLSAAPKQVIAECYRANPIENYDTVFCRMLTEAGVELLFYGSHATPYKIGPYFNFEFEDGSIVFGEVWDHFSAIDKNGNKIAYGAPDADHQFLKLFRAIDAVHQPYQIECGPEAARSQTLAINGIQESIMDRIADFPDQLKYRNRRENRWYVQGLDQVFLECYLKNILPVEAGISWASPGKVIDLSQYRYFPGGKTPEIIPGSQL